MSTLHLKRIGTTSVLLTAKYSKDGYIGAGEYMLWEGRDGWVIAFDRRKDGSCKP